MIKQPLISFFRLSKLGLNHPWDTWISMMNYICHFPLIPESIINEMEEVCIALPALSSIRFTCLQTKSLIIKKVYTHLQNVASLNIAVIAYG